MRQGTKANYTGNRLEQFIEQTLVDKGYLKVNRRHFQAATYLAQPVFVSQFPLCKGIYGTDLKCDFVIFHPEKFANCLVIEAKWQQSSGSVDEKFPYVVANIKECYPHAAVIVLDGGGYKPTAEKWLRSQVGGKLVKVMNMREFQIWANSEAL